MSMHFIHEMDRLHRDVLSMCSTAEEMIHDAIECLNSKTSDLAKDIAIRDREVDEWDVRIEEDCLKILALYHPVANDLRRVAVVLKIAQELERVADLSVSIAERAESSAIHGAFPMPVRLTEMTQAALSMLRDSIDSFVEQNATKAREVCARDDVVDQFNVELIAEIVGVMKLQPELIDAAIHVFSIVRHVERVADHATNIAEDVVYLVEGIIIRHPRLPRYRDEPAS
jgi:phosphate transport system protein